MTNSKKKLARKTAARNGMSYQSAVNRLNQKTLPLRRSSDWMSRLHKVAFPEGHSGPVNITVNISNYTELLRLSSTIVEQAISEDNRFYMILRESDAPDARKINIWYPHSSFDECVTYDDFRVGRPRPLTEKERISLTERQNASEDALTANRPLDVVTFSTERVAHAAREAVLKYLGWTCFVHSLECGKFVLDSVRDLSYEQIQQLNALLLGFKSKRT